MASHKMNYGVSAEYYSEVDIAYLKSEGIIDLCQVVHAGAGPDPNFVNICNKHGVSPIFNNGNDGYQGCTGDCNAYYANIAKAGYHAAGGESEPDWECSAIMANLPFLNYGGEWNGCDDNFSDIFAHGRPGATGHGIASYLETYIGVKGVAICRDAVVTACVEAKKHGCKEVGILVGAWIVNHPELSWNTAAPYINLINRIEKAGVTVSGVHLWHGFYQNMRGIYDLNRGIMKGIMAVWPPNMVTMKERFSGVTPPPPIITQPSKCFVTADLAVQVPNAPVVLRGWLQDFKGRPIKGGNLTISHELGGITYADVTAPTGADGTISTTQTFKTEGMRPYKVSFGGTKYWKASSGTLSINIAKK